MAEAPEMQLLNSSSDKPSSQDSFNHQTQAPAFNGLNLPNGDIPFSAFMYPGIFPPQQDQEPMDRGPGLYAVPVHPFMQPIVGIPSNALIPFTYNLPTTSPVIREAVQPVDPPEQQQQLQQQQQQQVGPAGRRVVVREFRIAIAIQIDLWLFIKLATAVYMLSRDGSRQRLVFLSFLAVIFYLYRTGALAPMIRKLKRRMRRVVGPHHPPQRAAFRANNLPADVVRGDVNAGVAGGVNENRATENEHAGEAAQGEAGNNRLRRIVKEIQIIVVGFVASLIPGFYND
ncbi:hypothetical protein ABFX02_10G072400 [Erythranthe guttata]